MTNFGADAFVAALAIIGIVIVVSALLSGLIDRSGLPQVAVFLGIGAALGPAGLGVFNITLDSPVLHVVATLSLTLVLFTDAVSLNISEVRRNSNLAFRMLGPGTIITGVLTALAAWWLLKIPPAGSAILGAALASTDPVLLRGLLRRRDIPSAARQALQLESGLNDAVLLPVVVVAMAFMHQNDFSAAAVAKLGLGLFILGPGAGVAIGLLAVAALDLIRKRTGVRRDYESLYSLGVAFTAFAAAEYVHGSGFLAAFAAGLTIAALDVELCDCFIEYGGVTAEMLLLFTFVLFGGSLIWSGFSILSVPVIIFAIFAMFVRVPVYLVSLLGSHVSRRGRLLIAWFGPSGLSSLLLILLPIFGQLPGSNQLFAICSLIVVMSVVIHGGSPMLLASIARHNSEKSDDLTQAPESVPNAPPEESIVNMTSAPIQVTREPTNASLNDVAELTIPSQIITLDDLQKLKNGGKPVVLLDVRTDRSLENSDIQAEGAVRLVPEQVAERARELKLRKDAWLIAYCA